MFTNAEQGVGAQFTLAGQFDDQTGQSAVGAVMAGIRQPVFDQGVLDDLPDPGLGLTRVRHARTPRRIIQRRPLRRESMSRAALRWWVLP